jgi:N4-gp56 family major capsid protein
MTISATTATATMTFLGKYLHNLAQEALWPQLFLYELGEKVPLPSNRGKHIFIPYYYKKNYIHAATEASRSDVTWSSALSGHFYSGTVVGRRGSIVFSDFFVATHEVPGVMGQAVKQLSQYLAQGYESLILTAICANGTYFCADGATASGAVVETTPLTLRGLYRASTTLEANDAPRYPDGLYAGVFHPKALHNLKINASASDYIRWATTIESGGPESLIAESLRRATIGTVAGIRLMTSTHNGKFVHAAGGASASNSAHMGFVIAPGAYACVDLESARPSVIIKPLGSGGATSDPANERMSVAVKGYFAAIPMDITATSPSIRMMRTAVGVNA